VSGFDLLRGLSPAVQEGSGYRGFLLYFRNSITI
jgi:hypothetical protein